MLNYRELDVSGFRLLVVEAAPKLYHLYVGHDGKHYCHYDSGHFEDLDLAAAAALDGFDPQPFSLKTVGNGLRDAEAGRGSGLFKLGIIDKTYLAEIDSHG